MGARGWTKPHCALYLPRTEWPHSLGLAWARLLVNCARITVTSFRRCPVTRGREGGKARKHRRPAERHRPDPTRPDPIRAASEPRAAAGSGAAPLRCPARPAGGAVRGGAGRGRSGAAVGGGRWAAGGRARRRQRLWAPRGAAPGAVRPPAGSAVSPVHGTAMEVVDETEALQRFFEGTAGGGQTFADRGLLQRCGLRAAAVRLREPAGPGAGRAESRDRRALRLLHAAPSERPGPSGCASGSQRTKLLRPAPWAPRPLAVGGAPGTAAPSFCLWRWDFCLSRSSVPQDGGFPSVSWVVW